jgi:SET domain-containing protein
MTPKPIPRLISKLCFHRLRIRRSKIQGWGVCADHEIPAHHKVIEYTGEKIGHQEAHRRWHSKYLFLLDSQWMIDGAVKGSGAEFINHSCDPNLETWIIKNHIYYISVRPIRKGEELTVDYNYDRSDERMPCKCGAKNCRGTINHRNHDGH